MTYPHFTDNNTSLLKRFLSKEVYCKLEFIKTPSEFSFADCIKSGLKNPDSSVGFYAGDVDCYGIFSELFTPVINCYHGVTSEISHKSDFSRADLPILDPEGKYIRSTRIRVARNVSGYSFTAGIDLKSRQMLEQEVVAVLANLKGEYHGTYSPYGELHETAFDDLKRKGLFFPRGDRFQDAAGMNRDYPACRGMFVSKDQRFRVWLNEEDHLRLISQQQGEDLAGVYNHLSRVLTTLGSQLQFSVHDRYGHLTSCPSNIGTTMRAGVHIQLKKLASDRDTLERLAAKHDLQIRGTGGEKTAVVDNVFDISNERRLGVSEKEIIQTLHTGLTEILHHEKIMEDSL